MGWTVSGQPESIPGGREDGTGGYLGGLTDWAWIEHINI